MFDTVCKFLAETFPADFATWLLGAPVTLTEISPSELSLEPIRADALILLQSEETVLHAEFQSRPVPDIPFRMADYRLRVYRRFPQKDMRQVVIYLKPNQSTRVRQNVFQISGMRHEFEVIRLWEQSPSSFLQSPGLLPFAVLAQTSDREGLLRQVAAEIDRLPERRVQSQVSASTAILAGLLLNEDLVKRVLRKDLMQDSVVYQGIKAEGREEGLAQERAFVVRLLRRKVGTLTELLAAQVQRLSLVQMEELGEALLEFEGLDDLEAWLGQLMQMEAARLVQLRQQLGELDEIVVARVRALSMAQLDELGAAAERMKNEDELQLWLAEHPSGYAGNGR